MFKKTLKKALALSLAVAMAFSGAQIAGVGGASISEAAVAATTASVVKGSSATFDVVSDDAGDAVSPTGFFTTLNGTTGATPAGLTVTGTPAANSSVECTVIASNAATPGTYYWGVSSKTFCTITVTDTNLTDVSDLSIALGATETHGYVQGLAGTDTASADKSKVTITQGYGPGSVQQDSIDAGGISGKLLGTFSDKNRQISISTEAGKCAPGTYTATVYGNNGTTVMGSFNVKVAPAAATASLTLGMGETQKVYYAVDASQTETDAKKVVAEAEKNLQVVNAVSVAYKTIDTKNYMEVSFTSPTAGDGGAASFTVVGLADGATVSSTLGTVSVTAASKEDITGIGTDGVITVEVGETVDIIPDDVKVTKKDGTTLAPASWSVLQTTGTSGTLSEYATVSAVNTSTVNVTGVKVGTMYVTATATDAGSNKVSKNYTLEVVAPGSVSVKDANGDALNTSSNPLKLDLLKNTTYQLAPEAPAGSVFTYSSSNASKVTVDKDGLVTAKAIGTPAATITVTAAYNDNKKITSTQFAVYVAAKPDNKLTVKDAAGVELTNVGAVAERAIKPNEKGVRLNLKDATETTLSVSAEVSGGQIQYEVAAGTAVEIKDKFTPTISTKTNVTGNARVRITVPETPTTAETTYDVLVNVTKNPLDTITTNKDSYKVVAGESVQIEASAAGKLTYVSNDNTVATVDGTGKVTGKAAGETFVIITSADTETTSSASKVVTILVANAADNTITVTDADTSEPVGDSVDIKGSVNWMVSALGDPQCFVESLNPEIVTTSLKDNIWTVTPNKEGSAVLAVISNAVVGAKNYAETTRYIVVNYGKERTTITADKAKSVKVGKTAKINASTSDGTPLSFTSNDTSVATVSEDGTVTGVGVGSTVVIIAAQDGALAATAITVTKSANTLTVKGKTASVKASYVAKKNKKLARSKVLSVSKAKGTVTYKKTSGNGKITIAKKTGKVTIKKGLKKGTYKVKVNVKAAGNKAYKAKTSSATIKIVVK